MMEKKISPELRGMVSRMAGMGMSLLDISKAIGINVASARELFKDELEQGAISANLKVAESIFKQATREDKPNIVAAIFWMKCRAGWREGVETTQKAKTADQAVKISEEGLFAPDKIPLKLINKAVNNG